MALDQDTIINLQHKLDKLKQEHHQLEVEIRLLRLDPNPDIVHIHRLKKQKLLVKDQITKLDALLVPDIIA